MRRGGVLINFTIIKKNHKKQLSKKKKTVAQTGNRTGSAETLGLDLEVKNATKISISQKVLNVLT